MSGNSNVRNFCIPEYLASETFCSIEKSQLNVSGAVVLMRRDDGGEELFFKMH